MSDSVQSEDCNEAFVQSTEPGGSLDGLGTLPQKTRFDSEQSSEGSDCDAGESLDAIMRVIARAPPRIPTPGPLRGTRFGASERYIIERRLGQGGMGTVYVATDTLLGRLVALKILHRTGEVDEDVNAARVLREARLAAQVEHERVARVYDVDRHDGSLFVAMEFVRGRTLRSYMDSRKPTAREIVTIVLQIAEGLAELHAHGVIHRDLKPENVMLTEQGAVKLLDFGLARTNAPNDPDGGATQRAIDHFGFHSAAGFSGTPGYVAPERFEGRPLDARVDVFALGVIVYELFTGRRPFSNRPIDMICRNHQAPIFASPIWEDLPGDLRVVVANMLSLEPERRPVDAAETLHRLREAAGHLAIGPDQLQREPQAAATIGRIRSFKSNASGPRSAFRSSRRRIAWFGASLCSALFAAFMVGPHFRQGAAHSWAAARLQRSSSTIFANTSTDPDWDQGRHDMHVPLENDIPAVDSGASNQKDGTIPISKHVQPASTQSRSARPSKPSGPFFDPGSFR